MRSILFSVHDAVSEVFDRPFVAPSPAAAMRALLDASKNPQSPMHGHGSDYCLFEVGTFDDGTGKITAFEIPKLIGRLTDNGTPIISKNKKSA